MEDLPQGNYLKFKPNALQAVRELYNLEKPGRIDEAVDLLSAWVKKQEHFKKKDYSRVYLEILLISNKGSIERSKTRLDKLCTLRSVWPEYFVSTDANCYVNQNSVLKSIILPDMMDDFTRINLVKINDQEPITPDVVVNYVKYSNIVGEYLKVHDYLTGFRVVIDLSNINIMNFLSAVTPSQISQIISIYLDGYGMRLKGIHILSQSKMVDALISVLKQLLSRKVGSRLYVHKTIESLYEFIPRSILPEDYGGDAPSYDTLLEQMVKEITSSEHIEYMKECNAASTEESKRAQKSTFNDDLMGVSGSFRTLCVD